MAQPTELQRLFSSTAGAFLSREPGAKIGDEEEGQVSESSPLLKENPFTTKALRVSFLVVDPTGQHETGDPVQWTNQLVLRSRLDESRGKRVVELVVAPRGEIRYTLDGSEPREGTPYTGPIEVGDGEVFLRAFAEAEGLEVKEDFRFLPRGQKGVQIDETRPARLVSRSGRKIDSRASTFEALKQAGEKGVLFESISLNIGNGKEVAFISVGEVRVEAQFLSQLLEKVLEKFPPDAPVTMQFQKAHFESGHDLKVFCEHVGLPLTQGDVEQ